MSKIIAYRTMTMMLKDQVIRAAFQAKVQKDDDTQAWETIRELEIKSNVVDTTVQPLSDEEEAEFLKKIEQAKIN